MASLSELRHERVTLLRAVRAVERTCDSSIERLERRLDTLIGRKTLIDKQSLLSLVDMINDFNTKADQLNGAVGDLLDLGKGW